MMKEVPIEEAVGMVLCHDVTEIVPGKFKGRAFRKGRIIQPEDIPKLLDIGKRHLYVLDLSNGLLHEDAAALRIARAAVGCGITLTEPSEGKVNLIAAFDGLLKVDSDALLEVNGIEEIVFSTLHTDQRVSAGRIVAGTRVVPLTVSEGKIEEVESICLSRTPVIEVKPFASFRVGLVITGSEIFSGRIEDKFGPVVRKKFDALGSRVFREILVSDSVDLTVEAIHELLREGADMIAVTGGMSVDPDDRTPASIRKAGGSVVTYGAPVLPGAMFMLAYIGDIPVLGLPGCVMYYGASIFDLIVPRILAGEKIARRDIARLGHGGLCAGCPECRYPVCPFGKGG
jgi:hypothetical protein